MATRDNVIDEKLDMLHEKKAKIETELSELPKFITNLIVKTGSEMYNLRTVGSVDTLKKAFYEVCRIQISEEMFVTQIADGDKNAANPTINGYAWSEWVSDFKTVYKKITLNESLNKVNNAIKDIEKFYSGDRKEENAFNALLGDIDNI